MNSMNKLETIEDMYDEYEFFDDVLNKPLDKEEAIKARRLEIDFFRARKVYEKVPRHLAAGHKIISTKWLDVDKGDKQRPNLRARLSRAQAQRSPARLVRSNSALGVFTAALLNLCFKPHASQAIPAAQH